MLSSPASEHEGDSGVESTNSSSGEPFVYIRISVAELNVQVTKIFFSVYYLCLVQTGAGIECLRASVPLGHHQF